ncbi:MAG: ATP-binding cassette domain-containing protein [Spirochaetales bacterium]|nr:ATP-binding cassette domain-containing protein [Spirochaetales bacterium]
MENILTVCRLVKTFKTKVKTRGNSGFIKSLFKPRYTHVKAVDDISFTVKKGEILAFLGPNGAGKSTTIKMITGILYPDEGTINILGMNPFRQRKKLAYKIGTVFGQKSQLSFHLPAHDSLLLLGSIYDLSTGQTKERIKWLSETFELSEFLYQPVRKLSLGQRIQCEIAASLLHEPEILFLDEPTIGLDVVVKQRIRDLIHRINREKGVTIFLTSHDTSDVEKICNRGIIINHGRIVVDDTIKNLKYSYMNRKIIDLKLSEPLRFSMDGVSILKQKGYAAKLALDANQVSIENVMQALLKTNSIEDIMITNPPMEEIIASIYKAHQ